MELFDNLADQFEQAAQALQYNLPFVLSVIGSLYLIHMVNFILGYRLNIFGIYPRKWYGLPGIFISPFLHGNFNHLFFNSIPLFALISFLMLYGASTFYSVTFIIILLGGAATWLFGRPGIHIGASGVIMGYWSYLLLYAYEEPTLLSIGLAIVCLYYFGGLLFNLFPLEVKTSWEAHVAGFAAGIATYFILPHISAIIV